MYGSARIFYASSFVILTNLILFATAPVIGQDHFNDKGSGPSRFTAALQQQLRDELPFEDQRDFEESRRGLIAEPDSTQIIGSNGNVVWDLTRYDFLLNGTDYGSIHPSL
ncbi:MAG: MBL fold metallo-hydrolase, partial [Pseudomonadales bacterium]|nr:MBL fold metallo-hydrolase [Pseudomonadales bacterium]